MKKKLLCIALALSMLLLAVSTVTAKKTEEKNYIWILEASGEAKTTLKAVRRNGVPVEYGFEMRYVSTSGSVLAADEGDLPDFKTRFTGACKISAKYDFRPFWNIRTKDVYSYAECLSQAELPNFAIDYDGAYSTEFDFYSSETSLYDSEAISEALGNMHSGFAPGCTDENFGLKTAHILINAEPDNFELGKSTDYGVRTVMILVTVYGSDDPKDAFSFESKGVLKRVPATAANTYSVLLSEDAKPLPETVNSESDGLEKLLPETALSRLKAYAAGGEVWPENLPFALPEFDEAERFTAVSSENNVVTVEALCKKGNLESYLSRLEKKGFTRSGGNICSNICYIKTSSEKLDRTNYSVKLEIYLPAKSTLPEGFEIFPAFKYGCVLKTPYGEGVPGEDELAFVAVNAYGASKKSVEAYGNELLALGFKYDLGEYTKIAENGLRYSLRANEFTDDFGSGYLLTFHIAKV